MDCGHICVPKGKTWGSTSSPHIGDVVMSLFFYSGVHRSWLGMAQKWSILDQNWPNMVGLSPLKSGQKGSKRGQNGQPKCSWPFGTLLGTSGPCWTISDKNDFFAPNGQSMDWRRSYTSWHSEEEREEAQVSRDQPKLVTRSLAQLILAAIWPKVLVGHQCLLTFLLRVPRSPWCHPFEESCFFRVSEF